MRLREQRTLKSFAEKPASERLRRASDHFGSSLDDHAAPAVGGAGAEIDDVVGGLHQLQIVLDDDQRMADGQQRVEAVEQLHDVVKVQAGSRLVEQEKRARHAARPTCIRPA